MGSAPVLDEFPHLSMKCLVSDYDTGKVPRIMILGKSLGHQLSGPVGSPQLTAGSS